MIHSTNPVARRQPSHASPPGRSTSTSSHESMRTGSSSAHPTSATSVAAPSASAAATRPSFARALMTSSARPRPDAGPWRWARGAAIRAAMRRCRPSHRVGACSSSASPPRVRFGSWMRASARRAPAR
ncbi:MAG: hypothetical protein ACK55I_01840, partial [bacterium]